nr:hypothetical protein Iba_chr03dCG7380 [Ipomoea batatas]
MVLLHCAAAESSLLTPDREGNHCFAGEELELPLVKTARREHIYMLCFATGDANATLEGVHRRLLLYSSRRRRRKKPLSANSISLFIVLPAESYNLRVTTSAVLPAPYWPTLRR